ncbi:DNA recombination protein RmuC [Prevotella copri]|uniref:DNA recombination protein RmuC n=1 Tax=Segatella copri TaxID=165179 RepID=A0AA90VGG8_9BACT|nr:DNA recombination protein RmuC [Segatella copri]MQO10691.1 DNA recombination protein RmuC [Segatella copri]
MEIVIGIVIGLAIGFFVGKLMEAKKAGEEKTQLIAKAQVLAANIDQSNQHHASELQSLKAQMENERLFAEKLRAESDQQWAQKLESLKQEMHRMTIEQQKAAAEQLAAKQSALQENNRLQMDELLKPIKEQFADFKKSVEESKTQNEVNKKELQSTFEATMKLFQQEQQQAVTSLKEQTSKIGSDAANLTKALKGDSKMQGDWGEMVLETILENSGLRKDEEFFIQENTKDENGKNFRPDVIVRFPEGRSVVIDSKVSLTAYTDALAAETDEERERLMKSHALSVRKHIDELAEKDYSKLVEDAIGFVLMFIPNETSYIAAMKQQPDLSRYAYQKKIIIISPSNLLMALQLAYNLWQYDRQNKNVEKIVKTAADLYDKVATFEDTFTGIGDLITRLSGTYDKAKKQLYDGTGNVMRRVESLKNLGVTPKKQIKALEE